MAQVDRVPKFNELMWPTLHALDELGGSGSIQEIYDKVLELERFSDDQLAVLHKNGPDTEIRYRLAWARTYLKGVGSLQNSQRGVWSITEQGRLLTQPDMAGVPAAYKAKLKGSAGTGSGGTEEGSETTWKEQLLQRLLQVPPPAFERLSKRLLREAGFINVAVLGQSGDGGIDGTGVYRISLVSFPVFFQCKRWKGSVGPKEVRDFRGAMSGRGEKGLLITTASFSKEARIEATRDGAPPVDLVDGDRLCDLLKEFQLGVTVATRYVEDVQLVEGFFEDI
jgi:restriction system protein